MPIFGAYEMKINVFTIVWNEEFMLPHFLKHYEKFADKIFIIDDHSTDRTAEIAKAHPKVVYSEYGFEGLNEQEFNDTFYSFYKNNPSDWAVVVDCDELIHGLDSLRNEKSNVLKTRGYMMIGKSGKLDDCNPVRMKTFDKPIVFDPALDVKFGDGRHSVDLPIATSSLNLLHYKYPSREHYLQRSLDTYPRIMDAKDMAYRIKRGLNWYDRHIK
jgi:glycosyltransferase involved in cell wall biosynthesis